MTTCTGKEGCKGKVILDGLCCRHLVQTCSICFEKVGSMNTCSTKRLSCGHSYHFDCILNWFATSSECPVCRAPQEADPIIKFKTKVQDEIREMKDKMIHLESYLKPLKSISNYKVEELEILAKKMGIYEQGKKYKKTDLYQEISEACTWL